MSGAFPASAPPESAVRIGMPALPSASSSRHYSTARGGRGVLLGKGDRDEGGDDAATLRAGMRHDVEHEVRATARPASLEHVGDRRLDALHQLDAAQAPACKLAQEPL